MYEIAFGLGYDEPIADQATPLRNDGPNIHGP
jgi:hypothetical protein